MAGAQGPYRKQDTGALPPLAAGKQAAARCGTRALLPWQLMVLVAFYLPSIETCQLEGMPPSPDSLWKLSFDDASLLTFTLLPMHLLVLVDGIATVRSWVAGRAVRRWSWRWLVMAPSALVLLYLSVFVSFESQVLLGVGSVLATFLLLPTLLWKARRTRGHRGHLFGSMATLAVWMPTAFLFLGAWLTRGEDWPGAVLHVIGVFAATIVTAAAVWIGGRPLRIAESIADARARHPERLRERVRRRVPEIASLDAVASEDEASAEEADERAHATWTRKLD